ncbi:hypothetical protein BC835DRAFT_1443758 [Cytidiella melzeri]|nr:hypothetical protein BC835DRAFT_1443758 [Cytidiella melzeri]
MDYSICKGSSFNSQELQSLLIIYDVCCQWRKRFQDRLAANKGLSLLDSIPTNGIEYAVGKFDLSAHVQQCYVTHTLNYIRGAGQLDGELMETNWGPLKGIVQSMRSMSFVHRREALDHQIRDHNWRKLVSCSTFHQIQ